MSKRKSISKKLRFDIFKRDDFTCQYCGSTPPSTVLEVDHIDPISRGGSNDIENLITACFDCNRGKSNIKLTSIPDALGVKAGVMKEKEAQLKEYKKLIKSIKTRKTKEINKVNAIFMSFFKDKCLSKAFKLNIKEKFLDHLTVDQLETAMNKACLKCDNSEDAAKYFCGICWNWIKGRRCY